MEAGTANFRGSARGTSGEVRPQDRGDIREFLNHIAAKGRSPRTVRIYAQAAHALASFAARRGMPLLADLTREHIEDYLRSMWERGNKPATVRNRYASIQQLFRWMREADIRADDPMVRISAPRVPEQVQPDYTPEEVGALLRSIPASGLLDLRDRALIALLYDTGVRCAELCGMRVGDVDREARRIHIRAGKGGRGRVVSYSHETATMLNRYVRKRGGWDVQNTGAPLIAAKDLAPVTVNSVRLLMLRRFKTAGLEFHGTHGFRRGWGQAFLNAGGDPMDLKELAGWSSLTMLYRYTKRTAQERALRAADQFSPMARVVGR